MSVAESAVWDTDDWDDWAEEHAGRRDLRHVDLPAVHLPPLHHLVVAARECGLIQRAVRPVVDPEAEHLVRWAAAMHEAMLGIARQFGGSDDTALLDTWVAVVLEVMDELCASPDVLCGRADAVVADVWVTATTLLHEGHAVTRRGLITAVCAQLHEVGGRHGAWCGSAQKQVWDAVDSLRDVGMVTVADRTVRMTGLGRYGVHRWVTDLGGSAPVREVRL